MKESLKGVRIGLCVIDEDPSHSLHSPTNVNKMLPLLN